MYTRIMKIKDTNPDLKIMLAIGGSNGHYPFEQLTADQNKIDSFAKNSIDFLRKWSFDGLGSLYIKREILFIE
jgi:chitinase